MDNQHKKIKGYRDLSQEEIDMMNAIKEKGAELGLLVEQLESMDSTDKRWVETGKTDVQKGLSSLIRGIAQPTSF